MLKEDSVTHLDKKWVVQIERWAFVGPLFVALTLLLGLREPLQPLWLFSICYGVSYIATFFFGWKGAFFSCLLSTALLYSAIHSWSLWHIAVFGSAYLALIVMGLCKEELHKNLYQYYRERQSLITGKEQIEQELETDRNRHKELFKEQKNTIELMTKEIEENKRQKRTFEEMIQVQEQNMRRLFADKRAVDEQLFLHQRDKHHVQGIIEQLKGQLHRYEELAKQESHEGKLFEQINQLRVEKFELSVLESSHLNEKLRMEKQIKETQRSYDELLQELDRLQKASAFTPPDQANDEIALAYTQLRKQFEEKRVHLHEMRKEYFILEGQTSALYKLKELEEWNQEAQLFSVISLQNELVQELEEKDKEIASLEELLTAGLQGKKDRPRLPPMKKLQTRAKRKKDD